MKKNETLGIYPGGFEEATITSLTQSRVFLKNRKGFIKYALRYGYKLQIVYCFGEDKLYWVFEPLLQFRLLLNKFKLPGVLFFSKLGILPDCT